MPRRRRPVPPPPRPAPAAPAGPSFLVARAAAKAAAKAAPQAPVAQPRPPAAPPRRPEEDAAVPLRPSPSIADVYERAKRAPLVLPQRPAPADAAGGGRTGAAREPGTPRGLDAAAPLSKSQVERMLRENGAFARAALECQRNGKVAEALEFHKRLQRNLLMLLEGAAAAHARASSE